MKFDHQHYVPCLRWKQGEYQAIFRLLGNSKHFITPLIEVPETGYDFETKTSKHTIDKHLELFTKRVVKKWGTNPCIVDISLVKSSERLADGRYPLEFVFDELRENFCEAIPATGLDKDKIFGTMIKKITSIDKHGLCIRFNIEEASKPELRKSIEAILSINGLNADQCDLVLDLEAPNFEPIDGFAKLCVSIIKRLPQLHQWRTFTLCATSIPVSMSGMKQGQTLLNRSEWLLYKRIVEVLAAQNYRLPTFGDYCINHPEISAVDMRFVKPYAQIRYTAENSWLIVKGTNVRDNGFEQYRDLCRTITKSIYYLGKDFSFGDEYIADCAKGHANTGTLTTWRMVGTSHHIKKVVVDISRFFGSGGNP